MAGSNTSIRKILLFKGGCDARDFSTSPNVTIPILRIAPVHVHVAVVVAVHVRHVTIGIPGIIVCFHPSISPRVFYKILCVSSPNEA